MSITGNHIIGAIAGGLAVYAWLKTRQFLRKLKAQKFDVSNSDNQLRFVQQGDFSARRPINKEAYQAVFAVAEKHLESMPRNYRLLAEVSMGCFLKTSYDDNGWQNKDRWQEKTKNDRAFKSINSKRVDFLIIDALGMPSLVIEYHGSGHYQGNAENRDLVKQKALENAGVPQLVVFPGTSSEDVKNSISRMLSG